MLVRFPTGRKELVDSFIAQYSKRFNVSIVGEPSRFLGFEIIRDRANRHMTLRQTKYIEEIANAFL
eukprot:scaffold328204_cov153-Tisochrysis_lutea.AAC.1